jgi:hypothetical protein
MVSSARWFGAAALSGLAFLGLLVPQAQAQRRPIFVPMLGTPGVGVNTNYWMNPYTTLQQQAFNTAILGNALSTIPPYALGFNPYIGGFGFGGSPLLNAGAYSPYGYGGASLLSGGYGGYGGYGYGYYAGPGTNPYYGYLRGAADITSANAEYQKTIQQARELRAKAKIAELDARRRAFDEIDYERNKRPTAETMRKQDEAAALNEARNNPQFSSILDGTALNTLLREAQKHQKAGHRAQSAPLDENTLRGINLTPGDTRGNVGLLKDGGKLRWPAALEGPEFADARKTVNQLLSHAVQEVTFNHPVEPETLKDLRAALADMSQKVQDSVGEMSPTEYISAQRYLRQLGQAVTALSDPKVSNYFNKNWAARGKNVADLVKFMTDNGLVFAPAVPGDENAYRAMYDALASYDAELAVARK